jgi:hypothetical protein
MRRGETLDDSRSQWWRKQNARRGNKVFFPRYSRAIPTRRVEFVEREIVLVTNPLHPTPIR